MTRFGDRRPRAEAGGEPASTERPAGIVRLSDVAERARCSSATASRVLNTPETVNLDARLRVEAAVRELGYTRDPAARALRSRRTRTIGVIVPTLRQPTYATFIGSLQDALSERGRSLIVTTHEFSLDREAAQARLLAERGIDGLVLVGHTHRPELQRLLVVRDLPYVTTYTYETDLDHPAIGFDNAGAMGKMVRHLLDLGHRDFGLLCGRRRENDCVEARVSGALSTLAAHGIRIEPERVLEAEFTVGAGRAGFRDLLARPGKTTAVVCTSDILAQGALVECQVRGIAVPSRMSITGFDGLDSSAAIHPALTTLWVPAEAMGRLAGQFLAARSSREEHGSRVALATRLVLRDTVAPPPP